MKVVYHASLCLLVAICCLTLQELSSFALIANQNFGCSANSCCDKETNQGDRCHSSMINCLCADSGGGIFKCKTSVGNSTLCL